MGNDPKANNLDPVRDTSAHTEVGGQGMQQPQQLQQQLQPQQAEQPLQAQQLEEPMPQFKPLKPEELQKLHELQQMQPLPMSLHPLRFSLLLLQQDDPNNPYTDAQREFIRSIPNWAKV